MDESSITSRWQHKVLNVTMRVVAGWSRVALLAVIAHWRAVGQLERRPRALALGTAATLSTHLCLP